MTYPKITRRFSDAKVRIVRGLIGAGYGPDRVAKWLGVHESVVWKIFNEKTYRRVKD